MLAKDEFQQAKMRKGETPVKFLSRIQELDRELREMGCSTNEHDVILQFLGGLPRDYDIEVRNLRGIQRGAPGNLLDIKTRIATKYRQLLKEGEIHG